MKSIKFALFLLWLFSINLTAYPQSYPPFFVTTYDSLSTGYYFTAPFRIGQNPNGISPTQMILDGKGGVVYYKVYTNAQFSGDFKLHENGLMSYNMQDMYYFMDSTFTVVDSVECQNGVPTDGHDIQVLPNGHFLLMGIEEITMDLSSFLLFGGNNMPGSTNAVVESVVIQELDVNKNVVFEWHASNHFAFDDIDVAWLNNPGLVDWTHSNAVELDQDGNILLSSRHFNEITKINRQTGAVIWRLGGNSNQFNFLNDPMQFKRQHDVRRLANGNITLFDNGDGQSGNPFHYASGKEYQLDESALTAQLVWNYIDDVGEFSAAMGNFQRKPAGNSLICYGFNPGENTVFNVVDDAGQKLFEVAFADTLQSYRSFNYESLPWNLNRPVITCYENSGNYFLDAGPGHTSYSWSNGATTQVIPLTNTGNYSVFVPKGQGGFISSETFEVVNMADPCGSTGITDPHPEAFVAGPSPFLDELIIQWNGGGSSEKLLEIFSVSGQMVYTGAVSGPGPFTISGDLFPGGVYWVRCGNRVAKVVKL